MSLYDRIVEAKDPFAGMDFAMFDVPKKTAPKRKWKWPFKGKPPRKMHYVCPVCGYEKDIPTGVVMSNPKLIPGKGGPSCPKCREPMHWDSKSSR